jgi:hypothetical protein
MNKLQSQNPFEALDPAILETLKNLLSALDSVDKRTQHHLLIRLREESCRRKIQFRSKRRRL